MRYCPNCGAEIQSGANFCRECGKQLENKTLEKNYKTKKITIILLIVFLSLFYFLSHNNKLDGKWTMEDSDELINLEIKRNGSFISTEKMASAKGKITGTIKKRTNNYSFDVDTLSMQIDTSNEDLEKLQYYWSFASVEEYVKLSSKELISELENKGFSKKEAHSFDHIISVKDDILTIKVTKNQLIALADTDLSSDLADIFQEGNDLLEEISETSLQLDNQQQLSLETPDASMKIFKRK